jgi:hypothetical protein
LNPRSHEAQLEDQSPRKSQEDYRRKSRKINKKYKKRQTKPKWQRRAKISSKPKQNERENFKLKNSLRIKLPPTLSKQALPLK